MAFGTPLFVLDEDDFRSRARAYAGRLHRHRCLLRQQGIHARSTSCVGWREEGLGLDVATDGELAVAERAAVPDGARALSRQQQVGRRADARGVARRRSRRHRLDRGDPAAGAVRRGGRRPAAGAGTRHCWCRGAHPRVHRDRPRGPEVRFLPGVRCSCPRHRAGAAAALARAGGPPLAHRLADLRHLRIRGCCAPRRRAAWRRSGSGTASSLPELNLGGGLGHRLHRLRRSRRHRRRRRQPADHRRARVPCLRAVGAASGC